MLNSGMSRALAHLSDEAVVALCARSDEVALAELYDRFGGIAYGLARRVVRDDALAEDAVQEAFLAIWRGAARFLPERGKASTWILTLVHRRAVDLVRREQRRRTEALPEAEPAAATGAADDELWLRLERERVQAALAKLPDQQREAIELAYYDLNATLVPGRYRLWCSVANHRQLGMTAVLTVVARGK